MWIWFLVCAAIVCAVVLVKIISKKSKVGEQSDAKKVAEQQQDVYFEWPKTNAPASKYGFKGDVFWYQQGVLTYVGYNVGKSGRDSSIRKKILDCVFNNILPRVNSEDYMKEWGQPKSSQRLKKIAESLAAFARNAKRKTTASYANAIADWESDLAYLYHKYYIGVFHFTWPRTDLR